MVGTSMTSSNLSDPPATFFFDPATAWGWGKGQVTEALTCCHETTIVFAHETSTVFAPETSTVFARETTTVFARTFRTSVQLRSSPPLSLLQ